MLQATCAKLIGRDHPVGRAAAAAADEWIRAHGFGLFVELLAEGLPGVRPEAATG